MPPDWLLWLVVLVVLGPPALTVAMYVLSGVAIAAFIVIDWVTP